MFQCGICGEDYEEKDLIFLCEKKHIFCRECFELYKKHAPHHKENLTYENYEDYIEHIPCPICRKNIEVASYQNFTGIVKGESSNSCSNLNIRWEIEYKDGLRHGITKIWSKSSDQLISEITYEHGIKHGLCKKYAINSGVGIYFSTEVNYIDGKKSGIFTRKSQNGHVIETREYMNDILDGHVIKYYVPERSIFISKKECEHYYINGKMNGTNISYWYNGNIMSICQYIDDMPHGIAEQFYENGEKCEEIHYEYGKKCGKHERWYKGGIIKSIAYYVNDMINGQYIEYRDDGSVYKECTFINGKYDGEYKEWHVNGVLAMRIFYVNGKGEGENRTWYKNGLPMSLIQYVKGKKNGLYQMWSDSGTLIQSAIYKENKKVEE